jgi:hypothetical protein
MLGFAIGGLCQSPPANDNFANPIVLTGTSIAFTGSLAGATLEGAETNYNFPGNSVGGSIWWTWTAPQSAIVTITLRLDYAGLSFSGAEVNVYTGTNLSALTGVDGGGNSFSGPVGRYVAFPATGGVSYQFRAEGNWTGPLTMKLTATNNPIFVLRPQNCTVSPYESALFSAIASAPPTYYRPSTIYQWAFNGVPIAGQSFPSLIVHNVTTNKAGAYSVSASNSLGVTETAIALLTVTETNPVPSLAALAPANSSQLPFTLTGEGGRW